MDRTRRRSRSLSLAAGLAGLTCLLSVLATARAAGPVDPPLRAARWIAPGADVAAILSRRPVECLKRPAEPDAAYRVQLGRAAFRAPLLLGGQAARAGIACESCHRNGRTNPDFAFPGVSGPPGAADVTSFVFSRHRGDGIDNPRPIPDLGGPTSRLKVSRDPASPDLKTFIHGLVTEEFDGPEPPPAVLDGLVAYVRALSPDACPVAKTEPVTLDGAVADSLDAASLAGDALRRGDAPTAVVMLQAARAGLAGLAEHLAGPALAGARDRVTQAAVGLAEIAEAARNGRPDAAPRLKAWRADAETWRRGLPALASRSLYNPKRLAAAFAGR